MAGNCQYPGECPGYLLDNMSKDYEKEQNILLFFQSPFKK